MTKVGRRAGQDSRISDKLSKRSVCHMLFSWWATWGGGWLVLQYILTQGEQAI
ncbi:hypothetical protein BDW66DRAFT_124356 [Aspergillus desertorum]